MLPEAVAIVMAPRDRNRYITLNQILLLKILCIFVFVTYEFCSIRSHGIFRLTTPGGMSVIRHCEQRGFHSHEQPSDGGPIYKQCTDVYMNPKLKFDIIDLR